MRRSICSSEPTLTYAGQTGTWKFLYTTAQPLPKGTKLRFDLLSYGRPFDWQIPETNVKERTNIIWALLPNGKAVEAKRVEPPDSPTALFDFVIPIEIKTGETIAICLGTPSSSREEQEKKGNRCQTFIQRRRSFHLYIDPKGKGDFRDPETFTIDVKGHILDHIRLVTPSLVAKNRRFDIMVRFEDRYNNLTGNAPEGTLIELSYEHLRDNLSWKLFVPETGFLSLPNLYFNEAGVYRIQLRNLKDGTLFYSPPIKCLAETDKSIYWGLFHGETERYDSLDDIEALLRYFRDDRALHFYASSPFESAEETTPENWKHIATQMAEFNEEGRFTTFLGFQWAGEATEEGLRQFLYTKDGKPLLRKKDPKSNTLKKIYRSHTPKDILSIPSFTMGSTTAYNFLDYEPEFERVVEIYNSWGSSECTQKEGNPRPIVLEGKKGITENSHGSLREALNRNCRFGFVAGGLDDRGVFSNCYESDQVQYSPGLTGVITTDQSRESFIQALHQRSCYATTGERMVIGISIAGGAMGSELSTKAKPGLAFNRHIVGYIAGTGPIQEVAFIRNGKPFHFFYPDQTLFEFAFDDSEHLDKVVIASPDDRPYFVYYYMRVIQKDGHVAWSSPIWIDYPEFNSAGAPKKPRKK